ncbi:MAG TPA: class I SAM-dependent methyltransferase [Gemmatimonadaceae bacterium]|jgi:SAM-dependent methyltransferase|nr:class I SAM-dependent methyltransferase [Gemmatimonadaceae bacterium]
MTDLDAVFADKVPELYDKYLVPLIFDQYAREVANRVASLAPKTVLEIAAGTGAVTRAVAPLLRESRIIATDLNQGMLDRAASTTHSPNVEWQLADALDLPFDDGSFDAVICQFAAMFFPDRIKGFSEARRVLRKGGVFIFSVWDRIEENEFADIVTQSMAEMFPHDPPRFLARTPHGYFDPDQILSDVKRGGFASPHLDTIPERSRADSPRIPAIAYCEGTPLRNEILARDAARLEEATDIATDALRRAFGAGPVDGKIQAHVITTIA